MGESRRIKIVFDRDGLLMEFIDTNIEDAKGSWSTFQKNALWIFIWAGNGVIWASLIHSWIVTHFHL